MAYIQQQQQAQPGNADDQTGVMSGTYEVHISEPKPHANIVGLQNVSTDSSMNQNNNQQQSGSDQRGHNTNGAEDGNNHQSSSTSGSEERNDNNDFNNSTSSIEGGVVANKTPNSYKYPLLKKYYEFGPWIGRNRKAICLGCRLQTSSSQPDRLLKHLNRCVALTDADKVAVQDLMNERTANKRKKPVNLRLRRENDNESYFEDEHCAGSVDDLPISAIKGSQNTVSIQAGGLKRLKREHPDRNSQIDEALTRFIMTCRIPLKAIHSQEFVEFIRLLNQDYHIPSRETITNVLIPGLLNII